MFRSRRWWQNYMAVTLSVLLVLALPIMVIGITQVQRFTDRAGSLQLAPQPNMVRVQSTLPEQLTLNVPQDMTFKIAQPATYNSLAVQVDPRYISNLEVKSATGWRWQKQLTTSTQVTYLFTTNSNTVQDELLTAADQISPVKCYPQLCPGERQITPSRIELTVTLSFTPIASWSTTQRPLMVTGYSLLTSGNQALYDREHMRPVLNLASVTPNRPPVITSLPGRFVPQAAPYEYEIQANDPDGDALFYTTQCPDFVDCVPSEATPIDGLQLEGSTVQWSQPQGRAIPYQVALFVTDGKSVAEQSYSLAVSSPTQAIPPTCEKFATAFPVTIVSDQEPTDLILVGNDPQGLSGVQIDFTNISVSNSTEQSLNWNFTKPQTELVLDKNSQPALRYQFKTGEYRVTATLTSSSGSTVTCPLRLQNNETPTRSQTSLWKHFASWLITPALAQSPAVAAGTNTAPQFTTDPYKESNVNMKVNEQYKYTLKVSDPNKDTLSFVTVTKPRWATVSSSQSNGELTLSISGTPTTNGSNTFSFSVSDGYASHWVTQTWLVNVEDPNNDTPKITITKPTTALSLKRGESLAVTWDAQDRQQIVRYDVYLASDPNAPQNGAIKLTNLRHNVRSVNMTTSSVTPGKYYVIVTGTDAFKPPATGKAISPLITITAETTPPDGGGGTPPPSTEVPYPNPVVTNVNPADQSTVRTRTPIISATVKASTNATLAAKSITIKVDDKDVTSLATITGDGKTEGTVVYNPPTFLDLGKRSVTVTVKDSNGKEVIFTWSFTVADATTTRTPEEPVVQPDDTEIIDLFGYRIPKQIALFVGLGLLILIIALILPLLLFFAWRRTDKKVVKTVIKSDTNPPSPTAGSSSGFDTPSPTPPAPESSSSTSTTNNYYSSDYSPAATPYVVVPSSTEPTYSETPPITSTPPHEERKQSDYSQITGETTSTASSTTTTTTEPKTSAVDIKASSTITPSPSPSEPSEKTEGNPTVSSPSVDSSPLPEPESQSLGVATEPLKEEQPTQLPVKEQAPVESEKLSPEPKPADEPSPSKPNHPTVATVPTPDGTPHLLNPAEELSVPPAKNPPTSST